MLHNGKKKIEIKNFGFVDCLKLPLKSIKKTHVNWFIVYFLPSYHETQIVFCFILTINNFVIILIIIKSNNFILVNVI